MTTGLQIIGNNGNVLIDENAFSYAVVQAGTVTTVSGTYHYYYNLTVSGTYPMLALRGDLVTVLNATNNGNGTWTFYIAQSPGASSRVVNYYVLDRPTTEASNYGLVLYNAAGQLVFDALRYQPKVVTLPGSGITPSNYALLFTTTGMHQVPTNPVNYILTRGFRITSTGVEYGEFNVNQLLSGVTLVKYTYTQYLVIDVTNLFL